MNYLFYKIKILFLRILGYEKPLRVALLKYLSLKFTTFRPHYETLIYESSKNAIKLGHNEINIIELGVAGDGIRSLQKYKKIERVLKIKINIIGFDTGSGLPKITNKKDLPFWKQRLHKQDLSLLEMMQKELRYTKVIFHQLWKNLYERSKNWINNFRFNLYSSTKLFLDKFLSIKKFITSKNFCYFDDYL